MVKGTLRIGDLLSISECQELIHSAEIQGLSRARLESEGRMNDEAFIEQAALADAIKSRLKDRCPIVEVDDLFEIYRYGVGDEIRTHTDRGRTIRNGLKSNATLLIYLSESYSGGCTVFTATNTAIVPVRGTAILFLHNLPHRAQPVISGTKYVARLDIAVHHT